MFYLKRGIATVSLLPIGSSYMVKFPLPSSGETWFTVDSTQEVLSFLEELKQEDESIFEISSENPNKLFKDLAETGIAIRLNQTEYLLKKNILTEVVDSKPVLASFIENLETSKVTSKVELEAFIHKTLTSLGDQFGSYLSALKCSLNEIETQIRDINRKEEEIIKSIKGQSNIFCTLGLGFLAAQWGFFYYTIYEVEWLGWDLMEPITFTVGQSGFVLSLFYYLKTKRSHGYSTMLARFQDSKREYLLRKNGINPGKLKYLNEEKNRILSLIDIIEKRLE